MGSFPWFYVTLTIGARSFSNIFIWDRKVQGGSHLRSKSLANDTIKDRFYGRLPKGKSKYAYESNVIKYHFDHTNYA